MVDSSLQVVASVFGLQEKQLGPQHLHEFMEGGVVEHVGAVDEGVEHAAVNAVLVGNELALYCFQEQHLVVGHVDVLELAVDLVLVQGVYELIVIGVVFLPLFVQRHQHLSSLEVLHQPCHPASCISYLWKYSFRLSAPTYSMRHRERILVWGEFPSCQSC